MNSPTGRNHCLQDPNDPTSADELLHRKYAFPHRRVPAQWERGKRQK